MNLISNLLMSDSSYINISYTEIEITNDPTFWGAKQE